MEPIKFDQPSLQPFIKKPTKYPDNLDERPHFVLEDTNGVIWTSVMLFLKKKI